MLQDLRYAIRTLIKAPTFTIVAIVVLALAIGANAAIFSFVDAMLLRPLPYPNADRLYVPVSINLARGLDRASISYADYNDWKQETSLFAAVALFSPTSVDVTGSGDPERIDGLNVSEEYFPLTAVHPIAGRAFQSADFPPSAARVVIISFRLWQRRFAGDPQIVGRQIRINGVPTDIIGVLPPRATYPEERDLVLPMRTALFNPDVRTRRDNLIFQGLARLADGVSAQQAEARMRAIASRLEQEDPTARKGWTNGLLPVREYVVEPDFKIALLVLMGAVAAVLLIGCTNLASLALVRGTGRARELSVRLALGAPRARLVRQLLAEALLLAVAGGALGIGVSVLMVDALRAAVPADAPFVDQVAINGRVMAAMTVMALLTAILFGVMPAITASGVRVTEALRDGTRAGTSRRSGRVRAALVVSEIALAVVLLVAAGLLARSLGKLTRETPGADIDRVVAARIGIPPSRYPQPINRANFVQQLTERLASEPGVQAAAVTTFLPVGGGGFGLGRVFLAEGWPEPPVSTDVPAQWTTISPDYFRTLGIPLVSGRGFENRDNAHSTPVIIVSQSFAKRAFGDESPLGRRIRSWRDENLYREIVGVVADVPFSSLTDRRNIVYIPYAQDSWTQVVIAVRAASGPPEALTPTLRKAVASVDPDLALARMGTMAVFAQNSIARERVSTTLMTALALSALVLAALGIYGVMSYAVAERRQEMGVRLALGASPRDLYRAVLTRGLGMTALGLAIGLGLAVVAARLLRGLLYSTSPFDAVAFATTAAVLAMVAFVACMIPARRAAGADPLVALRRE